MLGCHVTLFLKPRLPKLYRDICQFASFLFGMLTFVNIVLLDQPMCQGIFIILILILSIIIIISPSPLPFWKNTRPRWKRERKFWRCNLVYHLVVRCRRRVGNRPHRLDGTYFPSPMLTKHRRWRRRRLRDRYRLWRSRLVDHELFLNARKGISSPFKPNEGFPDDILCRFCEQVDFLSPMRFLGELQGSDHVANVKAAFARMNILLCNTSSNTNHRALQQCAIKTTPLVYDTGASHGLTPFRADFIDYK